MGAQCSGQPPLEHLASQHLDGHLGEGSALALKQLAVVLKEINTNVYKTPLDHPILVNLGMIMTQCKREERFKTPLSSGKAFAEVQVLMRAARYTKYAAAAYENGQEDILKSIQGDEDPFGGHVEILHVEAPSKACPGFFIASDKGTNEIVLSIRGIATMPEAITEAVGEGAPFFEGIANQKLVAKPSQVLLKAQEPIERALDSIPNCSVALVGHGIGGGVAVLATIGAFSEGAYLSGLAKTKKVKCYAYGAPPTFEPTTAVPPKCAAAIYSFVNGMDCVPRASPRSCGHLLQAVRKVDELEQLTPDRIQTLKAESEPHQEKLPDSEELPDELKAELIALHGVGTVLALFKKQDGKRACEKVPPELMNRILMHPDMARDHLIAGYEESISEMLMQLQRSKGCC